MRDRIRHHFSFVHGQSLVELLIAAGLGVIFIGAGVGLVVSSLTSYRAAKEQQIGAALAKELLDSARVGATANWHFIDTLSTSSVHYHVSTTSIFTVVSGDEVISLASGSFTRYFTVGDVYRDSFSSGVIVSSGGSIDPSTKKITVFYQGPSRALKSFSTFVARNQMRQFVQTDWSGGSGQDGPATTTNNRFASSTRIATSTSGSITLIGF